MIDLMKMPRSVVPSGLVVVLPLTLTPNPADPESLSRMLKQWTSLVAFGARVVCSSAALSVGCSETVVDEGEEGEPGG